MNDNWKPGDVALRGGAPVFKTGLTGSAEGRPAWAGLNGLFYEDELGADTRRLVVLDLDDSEKAALLERANRSFDFRSITADAIREQCSPSKPEEPTGLGAVVEDADGRRFVRYDQGAGWNWLDGTASRQWNDVAAVRVLSEGIS